MKPGFAWGVLACLSVEAAVAYLTLKRLGGALKTWKAAAEVAKAARAMGKATGGVQ